MSPVMHHPVIEADYHASDDFPVRDISDPREGPVVSAFEGEVLGLVVVPVQTLDGAPGYPNAAVASLQILLSRLGCTYEDGRLIIPDNASHDDMLLVASELSEAHKRTQLAIADTIIADARTRGDAYDEFASATGIEPGTLRNWVSVATHFPPARRRPALSFTHLEEVNRSWLPIDKQEALLDRAEREGLSVRATANAVAAFHTQYNREREQAVKEPSEKVPLPVYHIRPVVKEIYGVASVMKWEDQLALARMLQENVDTEGVGGITAPPAAEEY